VKANQITDSSLFGWFKIILFYVHMRGFSIEILVLERVCLRWSSKHFWQNKLVKSLLISTLDKVIYFKGTFLQHSTKPLFTTQNRLETSWKTFALFYQLASSRTKISMGFPM
jgi:hypothetical protein